MELIKKLNYREQSGMWVHQEPQDLSQTFKELQKEVPLHAVQGDDLDIPFLLIFVYDRENLKTVIRQYTRQIKRADILWFAYPKKSSKLYHSDINRDAGWEPLGKLGFEPVRQVALNEHWSALRFRAVSEIKNLTRRTSMLLSEEAKNRLKNNR